jgi:hypothetical protein
MTQQKTHQLVHLNVLPVELDAANAVSHVGFPAHKVCAEIVPDRV